MEVAQAGSTSRDMLKGIAYKRKRTFHPASGRRNEMCFLWEAGSGVADKNQEQFAGMSRGGVVTTGKLLPRNAGAW